jgi:peptide deformylase
MGQVNVARAEESSGAVESGVHRRVSRIRPVLEHPHVGLSMPSVEIDPQDPATLELAMTLVATMNSMPKCLGLAAPQIGDNVRLLAIDVTGHKKASSCAGLVVLANPRIVAVGGNVMMREGCSSVPHFTGDVARAERVIVAGYVPGNKKERMVEADAIEARCLLHEIDHLDGILFVDRIMDPAAELHARKVYG